MLPLTCVWRNILLFYFLDLCKQHTKMSERNWLEKISVFKALPLTGFFTACMGRLFPVDQFDNVIWFSNVPGPSKALRVSVSKFANEPVNSIIFPNICRRLKCWHASLIPILNMGLLCTPTPSINSFWELMKIELQEKICLKI